MDEWPFYDPPNVVTITVRQIIDEGLPILCVYHDEDDGAWQFLTGEAVSMADALVVCLKNIVARDPSIAELADLPLGWMATRYSREDLWHRQPQPGKNTP